MDGAALVARAQGKTLAKGSAKVAITTTSSNGTLLRATGAFDYHAGVGVLNQQITAGGRSTKQRIVIVKGVAYVSLPVAGNKYFKLDLRSLLGRSGGAYDLGSQLRLLAGATDSLEPLGSETVRGTATTHLRGTLDLKKALAAIKDAKLRTGLRSLQSGLHLPTMVPTDLWVDKDDLVRRIRQQYSIPTQTVAGVRVPGGKGTTTVDYYDFGTTVKVTAPPPEDVLGG